MTGFSSLHIPSGPTNAATAPLSDTRILGPKWVKLPLLTLGFLGDQVLWSVEMSYASPYLLSLGLSKSLMAIVFLAGPLSGLIVQPLIGVVADNSKSRFGRRRPYMIGGSFLTALAILLLGYTRPISGLFTQENTLSNDLLTIWLAVLAIYVIDFSINAVQAVDRALLVDILPASLQPAGSAWAAKMLGIGSVLGFFIGNINLPNLFPLFGSTQLEVLSVFSSCFLILTHAITAWCVTEQTPTSRSTNPERKTFRAELNEIWQNAIALPRTIRTICKIQFFAWIGWFPVLFYTTVYIGDIYKSTVDPTLVDDPTVQAEGTRLGSRALFYSSCLSLFISFALPPFIYNPVTSRTRGDGVLDSLMRKCSIELPMLWVAGHAVFAMCMFSTFFVSSVGGASIMVMMTGFSWAITQWVPFSLLGEAILSDVSNVDDGEGILLADTRTERDIFLAPDDDDGVEEERQHLVDPGPVDDIEIPAIKEQDGLNAKAGAILGIHNIFVVIPQFLVTGMASILFALIDPTKTLHPGAVSADAAPGGNVATLMGRQDIMEGGQKGWNSVAIIFRVGGVAATVAFVLSLRLARELRKR